MKKNFLFLLKVWPVVFLTLAVLSFLTEKVASLLGYTLAGQEALEAVYHVLVDGSWSERGKVLFLVLILAPISEELIFRFVGWRFPQILLKWIHAKVFHVALAGLLALVSSAAFMCVHYIQVTRHFNSFWVTTKPLDNAFIALFFFGLAQCLIYFKTKNILFPILHHFLFNLTNLIFLLVFYKY